MTLIYHITHADNLQGILREGGLWCDHRCNSQGLAPVNIAYGDLKAKRAMKQVPVGPGGTLAHYVPFYFAPRSPMLYAIHKGHVQGYQGGQEPVVHLVAEVEEVHRRGLPIVFSDGHAAEQLTQFYVDQKDLARIDWAIMREKYWNNTDEDGDRKRRRQAEFLVRHFFPWDLVQRIGVFTKSVGEQVGRLLTGVPHKPRVNVEPGWYY